LQEYGAACSFHAVPYSKACWITSEDRDALANFIRMKSRYICYDKEDRPVFMADTLRNLKSVQDYYPAISFHFTSELNLEQRFDANTLTRY
jgi:peptide chain release factor 3